jgi:UDP-glucose 4-epimerase
MTVLLTGISSFVGSHLARHLVRAGHKVVGTYRTRNGRMAELEQTGDVELLAVELAEEAAFGALPASIDAIVHVAAVTTGPEASVEEMLRCNVTGTENLVRYALAAGVQRFVYMSSLSVHGTILQDVVDERTPVRDPDVYGASKFLGERIIAARSDALPSVALRLPGVLGAGAHYAWIPSLMEKMRAGRDVTIYNADAPFNNGAHVDDIGAMTAGLLSQELTGFAAMPLGARDTMSVGEVANLLVRDSGAGVSVSVNSVEGPPGFTISSERACRDFGYDPMPMAEMLERYVRETMAQS